MEVLVVVVVLEGEEGVVVGFVDWGSLLVLLLLWSVVAVRVVLLLVRVAAEVSSPLLLLSLLWFGVVAVVVAAALTIFFRTTTTFFFGWVVVTDRSGVLWTVPGVDGGDFGVSSRHFSCCDCGGGCDPGEQGGDTRVVAFVWTMALVCCCCIRGSLETVLFSFGLLVIPARSYLLLSLLLLLFLLMSIVQQRRHVIGLVCC